MQRIIGLLALCAILFGLAGARADTVTGSLTFQTKQSLWGSSPGVSTSYSMIGTWPAYTISPEAEIDIPVLGHFSAGVNGSLAAGRAGLKATAYANGGTVTVNYPLTLTLTYPGQSFLAPGQSFQIHSSWTPGTPTGTPSLATQSPAFGAKLDGVLQGGASLDIALRAFGDWLPTIPIFDLPFFDFNKTIFDTQDLNGNGAPKKVNPVINVAYKQPKINLNNEPLLSGETDLLAIGTTPLANNSTAGFVGFDANFSNAIAWAINPFTPLRFSGQINASHTVFGQTCGFTGGYDFLSLNGSVAIGMQEQVRFHPDPQVTLLVTNHSGTSTVTFPAGGFTTLTMPSDGSALLITPVVSLDNTFFNELSASLNAQLTFNPFDVFCTLSVPGISLPTLSYDAPAIQIAGINGAFPDLYDNTFTLGFDPLSMPSFSITLPPPPPPTPLVATNAFYSTISAAGTDGVAVYEVAPGAPSVLSADSGPAGFYAVAQHVQPDPNDPDTYFDLNENGTVSFSIAQSKATGVGQFSYPYQITDGQGHFASATIIITIGTGG